MRDTKKTPKEVSRKNYDNPKLLYQKGEKQNNKKGIKRKRNRERRLRIKNGKGK